MLHKRKLGFTIVEVTVAVVIVGILVSLSSFAFNTIQRQSRDGQRNASVGTLAEALEKYFERNGEYPSCAMMTASPAAIAEDTLPSIDTAIFIAPNAPDSTTTSVICDEPDSTTSDVYSYIGDGSTECSTGSACKEFILRYKAETGGIKEIKSRREVNVVITNGSLLQSITSANCPSTRTRAVDARDNRTYWVQKLPDGKCWMLTNLAYAGGGVNTYGDAKPLTEGTAGSPTYEMARYYIPTGANPTTEPASPSLSTSGTGQYGYLYNWCAAMGEQIETAGCKVSATPPSDTNVSICPANWRLPIGGTGGEFEALNTAVNSGSTTTSQGLRENWLGQYSGSRNSGSPTGLGTVGAYWSSTQASNGTYAHALNFSSSYSAPAYATGKHFGFAVRCIAK